MMPKSTFEKNFVDFSPYVFRVLLEVFETFEVKLGQFHVVSVSIHYLPRAYFYFLSLASDRMLVQKNVISLNMD